MTPCDRCDGTGWERVRHHIPAGYKAGRIEAKPEPWDDVRVRPCGSCDRGRILEAAQAARRGKRQKAAGWRRLGGR